MTIWYWDPINGTDANASAGNGDSFATRRKKANNFVAAATAPGDTIRCMKSPDPTSLGINGTWTKSGADMSSAVTINSSTNATPIVLTLNSANYTTLGAAVGDTVVVTGHTTNTNANGTWKVSAVDGGAYTVTIVNADGTNSVGNGVGSTSGTIRNVKSNVVILASAITKNIALTGNRGTKTNWTASANVTCTVSTSDYKEGAESQSIAIAAGFTTGLAAYWALPASTDFSAYKQISFWIKQTAGTVGAAGDIQLKLCSDTAGATAVDTFNIPALSTGAATSRWTHVTVDKGSALGSAIQSIAFYVVTDNAAQTFLLDNVIACKDSTANDSLTLCSSIGKNVSTDTFYSIQSINDVRVMIDADTNTIPSSGLKGYWGASETVTTYKRETFRPSAPLATQTGVIYTIQESGAYDNAITYSGGWNSTDMSTQTGETWFDGQNGYGALFSGSFSITNVFFEKLAYVNGYMPVYAFASGWGSINFPAVNHCTGGCALTAFLGSALNVDFACNNATIGIQTGLSSPLTSKMIAGNSTGNLSLGDNSLATVTQSIAGCTAGYGITFAGGKSTAVCPIFEYNAYGVSASAYASNRVIGAVLANNYTADVSLASLGSERIYFNRCTFSSTTQFGNAPTGYRKDGGVYSASEDNTQHNDIIYTAYGNITKQNSARHTASGYAWKMSPTTSQYFNSQAPMMLKIATWAISSGVTTTFSVYMYRDNTGLSARLVVRGGSIAGIDADVQSSLMSEAINTWGGNGSGGPLSVAVTPTETGVVEVWVECWADSTTYSLYVDDFSAA